MQSISGDQKQTRAIDGNSLLPVQYFESIGGGRPASGEFKLFFAILEDALRSYVRFKTCRSNAGRAEYLDAQAWFYDLGAPHLFSFESTCEFLEIDPRWLRQRLGSLRQTDFPRKQIRTCRRRPSHPPAPHGGKFSTATSLNIHDTFDVGPVPAQV
jgi:hypothetical protein